MRAPLHLFTLLGIPVFADGMFAVLLAISVMGAQSTASGFVWAACLTGSLLVHEFGHGLVARAFGLRPAILLHGWGGLCLHEPSKRDRDDALIIAAGPAIELTLGLAAFVVSVVLSVRNPALLEQRPLLAEALFQLVWINVVWGMLNLVPLWPLDGGQLFRLAVLKLAPERVADRIVHGTGFALGLVVVGVAIYAGAGFLALLAGLLAWENLDVVRGRKLAPAARRRNGHADALVAEARVALDAGNPREALRLAHQIRATTNLPDDVVASAWEILVVGSVAAGQPAEALRYARYAPDTPAVREARAAAERATAGPG